MNPSQILSFMHEMENLKKELRHSWLSDGRQESVAEHIRRVSLLIMLVEPHLDKKVDTLRLLKMAIVHDMSEAYVGDVPSFDPTRAAHVNNEIRAMNNFMERFDTAQAQEFYALRMEYEVQETYESKVLKALDKLEMRIQHNEGDISTRSDIEFPLCFYEATVRCEFDSYLKTLNTYVEKESTHKIIDESEKDIEDILEQARAMYTV